MTAVRILLVDDDETIRALLRMTLPPEELEVTEARDAAEALEAIDREMPDLALLDWIIPGGTGARVLEELKRRRRDLPVIVLTAELDNETRARAEELGADAFLTKPFSPLELMTELERLLPKRAR